jgi:hypothetical protein
MKIPLTIFAGLAVGIVGYLVYKRLYLTPVTTPGTPAAPGSNPASASSSTPAVSAQKIPIDQYKWLEKGSKDANGRAEVKFLQSLLRVPEDGNFGQGTESALMLATGKKKITLYGIQPYIKDTFFSTLFSGEISTVQVSASRSKYAEYSPPNISYQPTAGQALSGGAVAAVSTPGYMRGFVF